MARKVPVQTDHQTGNDKAESGEEHASAQSQKRKDIIGRETAEALRQKIETEMETSDKVFSPDFSLDMLAEIVGCKPRILSYVINEYIGKSFYNMLNERRVREACTRLEDKEKYGHMTIEGISASLGYKSRTTLVSAFKNIIGISPSEYQKAIMSKPKSEA